MTQEEIRMECLTLACEALVAPEAGGVVPELAPADEIVDRAQTYADFVMGRGAAKVVAKIVGMN